MFHLTVRDQLRLGYLAVIVVLLIPLLAAVIYIGRTSVVFAGSTEHHKLIFQAQDMAIVAQQTTYDVMAYTLGETSRGRDYGRNRQLLITAVAQIQAVAAFLTPEQRTIVQELGTLRDNFDEAAGALLAAADKHREIGSFITLYERNLALDVFNNQTLELKNIVTRLVTVLERLVEEEASAIQRQITNSAAIAVVACVAAFAFAMIISQWVTGHIVPPITHLAAVAKAVSFGDLSQRAHISAPNEIGELGATFDQMADQLSKSITALEHGLAEATAARKHAEHAEKIKGAFLASMSHELRTPLNAIINFTRFVSEGDMGPVNTQQKELLREVVSSGKHLLSLINDVLDMSKIEAGSLSLYVEEHVSVIDLLHTLTTLTQGLIASKPVQLLSEFPDDLPMIRADRQRLYQSLLNVASNAAKFTDEGEIKIIGRADATNIYISISDSGPGIAPHDIPAVFEAFKQTESGMRVGRGTGLGMPIAKNLIEAHGGTIHVESTEGQGTIFTITVPIKSESLKPVALFGREV